MPQTPKIKLKNIQELAKIAKEVIPVVQPYIVKYAPKIAEEAQKRASNAADNGKRMKLEFLNGMEEKKKSRAVSYTHLNYCAWSRKNAQQAAASERQ